MVRRLPGQPAVCEQLLRDDRDGVGRDPVPGATEPDETGVRDREIHCARRVPFVWSAREAAVKRFWKDSGDDASGRRQPADGAPGGFLDTLRETFSGGAGLITPAEAPAGRAERLGLAETGTAPALPFAFLRLGDKPKASAVLQGRIGGLGACVFEFSADEFVPARNADGSADLLPWSRFRYHVAALELGFPVPWFAVAVRRMHAPAQRIYAGRRGAALGLPGRPGRDYVLYADDAAAVAALTGPLREWLGGVLVLRIKHRPLVTIEVSDGWVMCAIQAGGMAAPDAIELRMQGRPGHPGPWPDVLLQLLQDFRGYLQNPHSQPGPQRR